jgi:hypothetical protein
MQREFERDGTIRERYGVLNSTIGGKFLLE